MKTSLMKTFDLEYGQYMFLLTENQSQSLLVLLQTLKIVLVVLGIMEVIKWGGQRNYPNQYKINQLYTDTCSLQNQKQTKTRTQTQRKKTIQVRVKLKSALQTRNTTRRKKRIKVILKNYQK